ncbi:MAG: hypothetical protein CME64_16320 [Halobacteriovoraceae bacterium]|nr:hypothetical protein [Halobacteriovoraceae bacterium]|tara:strand:+ start:81277 stop:82809 length:1533 start_codon:yes stop_codon:yes gene_type:complete
MEKTLQDFYFKTYVYENVTNYGTKNLQEVIPEDLEELQEIVQIAIRDNTRIYPVSTGFNWGMGSKIPVDRKSIVINLSKLNKILEYDEKNGVVVLEPGVTQEQLSDFLKEKGSPFYLDVTGSSKETSVVGNTLERGISYNSLRVESVMGLEVLTGKGDFLKTGNWRLENTKTKHSYKFGVGADLTGLFFQSNFGIVTKMAFKLKRFQEAYYSVQLKFKSLEDVSNCLDVYSELFEEGTINSIFHIANTERAQGAVVPFMRKVLKENGCDHGEERAKDLFMKVINSPWVASGIICGNNDEAKYKVKRLKRKLKRYAKIEIMNVKFIERVFKILSPFKKLGIYNVLLGTKPFRFLYFGEATNAALGSVLNHDTFLKHEKLAEMVDGAEKGFSYCLPITDLSKQSCLEMVEIIKTTAKEYSLDPSITLNPLLANVLEAVVSVEYPREDSKKARECVRLMQERLNREGHYSYRTNIKDMDLYFSDKNYLNYLREVKKAFDPNGLISPGRYLPER